MPVSVRVIVSQERRTYDCVIALRAVATGAELKLSVAIKVPICAGDLAHRGLVGTCLTEIALCVIICREKGRSDS